VAPTSLPRFMKGGTVRQARSPGKDRRGASKLRLEESYFRCHTGAASGILKGLASTT